MLETQILEYLFPTPNYLQYKQDTTPTLNEEFYKSTTKNKIKNILLKNKHFLFSTDSLVIKHISHTLTTTTLSSHSILQLFNFPSISTTT